MLSIISAIIWSQLTDDSILLSHLSPFSFANLHLPDESPRNFMRYPSVNTVEMALFLTMGDSDKSMPISGSFPPALFVMNDEGGPRNRHDSGASQCQQQTRLPPTGPFHELPLHATRALWIQRSRAAHRRAAVLQDEEEEVVDEEHNTPPS